jgi:hypothetical protein
LLSETVAELVVMEMKVKNNRRIDSPWARKHRKSKCFLISKFFCREEPPRRFQPTISCALQRFANARRASWPGLSRPSTSFVSRRLLFHSEGSEGKAWMPGTRPGMTEKQSL